MSVSLNDILLIMSYIVQILTGLFLYLVGQVLKDHYQMATFSAKLTLQSGICMLQIVSTHLKNLISKVFWSLLQTYLLVEVLFVIAGMLNSHFAC